MKLKETEKNKKKPQVWEDSRWTTTRNKIPVKGVNEKSPASSEHFWHQPRERSVNRSKYERTRTNIQKDGTERKWLNDLIKERKWLESRNKV